MVKRKRNGHRCVVCGTGLAPGQRIALCMCDDPACEFNGMAHERCALDHVGGFLGLEALERGQGSAQPTSAASSPLTPR